MIGITWGRFNEALLNLPSVDIILGSDCFYDSKGLNSLAFLTQIQKVSQLSLCLSLSLILDSDLEGPSSLLFALSLSLDQKLLMVSLLDHLSVCLKPSSSPFSPDEISFNQTA